MTTCVPRPAAPPDREPTTAAGVLVDLLAESLIGRAATITEIARHVPATRPATMSQMIGQVETKSASLAEMSANPHARPDQLALRFARLSAAVSAVEYEVWLSLRAQLRTGAGVPEGADS